MVFLYSDVLYRAGGIETYLHALASHLQHEKIPSRAVVAELEHCPLLDELAASGIKVYRQRRVPGDRWLVRQRVMMAWLSFHLKPGDWVYCVRQPEPKLYLSLARMVHRRGARIAASWMFAPEFLPPTNGTFCQAVAETDAVISVSRCTAGQFRRVYGYEGKVSVVPYHNLPFFDKPVPLPAGPPWKIGYLGRLERKQKNLDQLLDAFATLASGRTGVELHLHGHGPDQAALEQMVSQKKLQGRVFFHGPYDHRRDLPDIMARCHFFVYPSLFEGGPCFTLLELMQAGRFCVASRVGGIPDLYEGHPEAGSLVGINDVAGLTNALETTVEQIANGKIDGERIRARYFEGGFDLAGAHRAWMQALALDA